MTTIALIDDHSLFSASLAVALTREGFDVAVPQLSTLEAVRGEVVAMRPDVAIIDRDLGEVGRGETLIEPISRIGSSVIVLSAHLSDVVIGECLARGAAACLSKSVEFESLLSTVTGIVRGAQPLSESKRYGYIDAWRRWKASTDAVLGPFTLLTRQEEAVLRAIMDGQSVKAIASERCLSTATVRTHVRGILTKLGVTSQVEAIALARKVGWDATRSPHAKPEPRP